MEQIKSYVSLIINAMYRKDYDIFLSNNLPFNINIVGIRSTERKFNKFNDRLIIFWRYQGKLYFGAYPITTYPGDYYLINKLLNRKGAAILKPGQYIASYAVGLHKGKYTALVQQKPVTVFRDGNRDEVYDLCPTTLDEGLFGINIHKAYKDGKAPKVGSTSAGCQVFQTTLDFDEFMDICENARKVWGNSFTYTLLDEADLLEAYKGTVSCL